MRRRLYMSIKKIGCIFTVLFLCFILSSCQESTEKLTIGMIPVREAVEMEEEFEPIRVYLEEKLEIPIEMIVTDNYASLVEGMKNETIDIGWYGAFSYIAAESELDLTPLVVQQRKETGIYYNSLIITGKDSGIHSVEDLEGKKFAFVDAGSTSGFVMPYSLLVSRNIDYETFFSESYYSGTHEQVPVDILQHKVDAGAISSVQFTNMIGEGKIQSEDFITIWESGAIPGSLYVARSELDDEIRENLVHAMLTMHKEIPNDLGQYDNSIEKYVEVESKEYNTIRNTASILGKEYMYEHFLKAE